MGFLINLFISPIYRIGALVLAVLSAVAVIYGKGRSDASGAAKIKAYKETQDAIEKASRARAAAASAPDQRLRDNDGFRRD